MNHRLRVAIVACVTAAAAIVGLAPLRAVASTSALMCGQTVMTSVTLEHDLLACPGDGLVVGAPGVTIDLHGHSITGVNAPHGEGIADDGHGGVVIKNGRISGFFVDGVALRKAPGSTVRGLTIDRIGAGGVENQFSEGIEIEDSPGIVLVGNTVTNDVHAWESDGIVVKRSPYGRIVGNRLSRNAWDGLAVFVSPHTRVEANRTDSNVNNGIEVNGASDSTAIIANCALGNANVGIAAGNMRDASIIGNVTDHNGFGPGAQDRIGLALFDLLDSRIMHNHADRNRLGIDLIADRHESAHNVVSYNEANGNTDIGLLLVGGEGATHTHDNVLTSNTTNANGDGVGFDGGIVVAGVGNALRANTASANRGSGVLIAVAGNTLTRNRADRNTSFGINATAGTVDGGDNRAHDNLRQPQCIGVKCG